MYVMYIHVSVNGHVNVYVNVNVFYVLYVCRYVGTKVYIYI